MSADWPIVRLSDCASFQEGYVNPTQKKPEYFDGDVKWLRAVDLNNGYVKETTRSLTKAGFESAGKSALLFKPGTLAISKSGTIGRIGMLQDYMCGNRAVINIKVNNEKCNNRFIFYVLLANRPTIENLAIGSVQKNLYTSALGSLEFRLPPREIQDVIAESLGSLDDKIQLNRQTNQTLEHIAQAIFKSWFVDFEPVKAKIEAKQNGQDPERAAMRAISGKTDEELDQLNPEQRQQLTAAAALFPNELEDSELGEIPKGWTIKPLDKIANFLNGLALQKFPSKEGEESLPVIKIAQLKKGNSIGADRASKNIKPEYIIENGDVIFSWSGSLFIDIWCGGLGALNQHLFKVTSDEYPKWFYYFWTNHHLAEFQRIAADKAVTMGHIKRGHLSTAMCLVPDEKLINSLGEYISSIVELSVERRLENFNLEDIRDSLLPKLLSGEITLGDTQSTTEAVA